MHNRKDHKGPHCCETVSLWNKGYLVSVKVSTSGAQHEVEKVDHLALYCELPWQPLEKL